MDKEKVLTQGKAATGKLLIELQVRKSTADGEGARKFYTDLTEPLPGWEGEIRDLVLKKKLVRFRVTHIRRDDGQLIRVVSQGKYLSSLIPSSWMVRWN